MSDRRQRLRDARLYLVCDQYAIPSLDDVLAAGVDIVQLRMKNAADAEVLSAGHAMAELCAAHQTLFILNDRPDLAARLNADGVHVGQDDVSVAQARRVIGPDHLVGLSTHTPQQIDDAREADYIGVGPVYSTPTKPGRPAVGLELVRYAAAHATVPFFAIGGIDPGNVDAVRKAGAARIAVVRAITEDRDPAGAARALRAALPDERTSVGTT